MTGGVSTLIARPFPIGMSGSPDGGTTDTGTFACLSRSGKVAAITESFEITTGRARPASAVDL